MSKAILTSKSPSICANVLNKKANILIFKKFPNDFKGWVYIYCTKDKKHLIAPFRLQMVGFIKNIMITHITAMVALPILVMI